LNLYRLDNGAYPSTEQGLDALAERPALPPAPRAWRAGGYLDRVPVDPWGRPFVYVLLAADRFVLTSLGRDGVEGGDGYDRDLDGRDR
jgi:general secretion pathway protein G